MAERIDYLRISITDTCNLRCPVLYAGECGGLCTGAGGTESAAYRRRDAEDCARRGWAWHHALPDYRRGTAGKKKSAWSWCRK